MWNDGNQAQIQSHAEVLGQKEKEIQQVTAQRKQMIGIFRILVHLEKLKILEEFKSLRQSLEEEERYLLSRLGWLEQEGGKQMEQYVTVTEGQLTSLRKLSCKPPCSPESCWRKDIKDTLSRSEEYQFIYPTPVPLDLAKNINEAKSRHESFAESLKKFKDDLQAGGKADRSMFLDRLNEEELRSWCLLEKTNPESPSSVVRDQLN